MGTKKTKTNNNANNKKKLNKSSQKLKLIVLAVSVAVVLTVSIGIIGFMTTSASINNNDISSSQNLTGNWMDVHGVGIYSSQIGDNNNSLYLATHNG